jgi:soluble lytic murein transglycosylase-like protein
MLSPSKRSRRAAAVSAASGRVLGWGLALVLAGAAGGCDELPEPRGAAVALAAGAGSALPPASPAIGETTVGAPMPMPTATSSATESEPMATPIPIPSVATTSSKAESTLWGYVDGAGTAHFADWQIDSRYAPVLSDSDGGPHVLGKKTEPQALLTWLEFAPDVKALAPIVSEAARRSGVDRELLEAVIAVESGYNAKAVSPRGAVGLMQLTPETADRYATPQERREPAARRMLDARTNVLTGARMLADLTRRYGGIDVALAAWNAGEGTVRRAGGRMPAIAETEAHVHLVLELYWALLQRSLPQHVRRMEMSSGGFERESPGTTGEAPNSATMPG